MKGGMKKGAGGGKVGKFTPRCADVVVALAVDVVVVVVVDERLALDGVGPCGGWAGGNCNLALAAIKCGKSCGNNCCALGCGGPAAAG